MCPFQCHTLSKAVLVQAREVICILLPVTPWLKYRSLPFNRSSFELSEKPKNSYVTFLTRRLARLAKMASTQSVSQDHTDHKPSFSMGASASNTTTRKWGRLIQAASGGMIGGGGGASDLKRGSLGGAGAGKNLP